jgi:uncharacterized membrane protein (Fun14 family)
LRARSQKWLPGFRVWSDQMWADKHDIEMIHCQLVEIKFLVLRSLGQENVMQVDMDRLREDVQKQTSVSQSAVELITGLAARIRDAVATDDSAALQDLANQVEAQTASLARAITENTLSAPNGPKADPVPMTPAADPEPIDPSSSGEKSAP